MITLNWQPDTKLQWKLHGKRFGHCDDFDR